MDNYGNLITQFPQFEPLTPILEFENKEPFIRNTNYNNLDIKMIYHKITEQYQRVQKIIF